jgi:hypothetical protein
LKRYALVRWTFPDVGGAGGGELKKFDVSTLVMHGDDDQIVPIVDSWLLSAKIVKTATPNVNKGTSQLERQSRKSVTGPETLPDPDQLGGLVSVSADRA